MKKYDYLEAIKSDVLDHLRSEYTPEELADALADRESLEKKLGDDLWTVDGVTGNSSGSYTFNTWEAEENLCHNLDLLAEALQEFGSGSDYMIKNGPEACDVTIRCYLLDQAIAEALNEIEGGARND